MLASTLFLEAYSEHMKIKSKQNIVVFRGEEAEMVTKMVKICGTAYCREGKYKTEDLRWCVRYTLYFHKSLEHYAQYLQCLGEEVIIEL